MDLNVTIYKNNGEGQIKAGASVVIDNAIVIKGIKVIEGANGLFVAMPSRPKRENGETVQENGKTVYNDIVHPISAEAREIFVKAVLDAYNKA